MTGKTTNRRTFVVRSLSWFGRVGVIAGVTAGYMGLRKNTAPAADSRGAMGILRPPGALAEQEFLASCIRCARCSDSCESGCIQLFGPAAGALQGTPYILPIARACTLCLKCGEACPTGALLPLEKKEEAVMGVAVVDERLCVSHNGTGVCGACHTACPLKNRAITQELRNAPIVHAEYCTGCGLCEECCIVDERSDIRAIQVKTKRRWPGAEVRAV